MRAQGLGGCAAHGRFPDGDGLKSRLFTVQTSSRGPLVRRQAVGGGRVPFRGGEAFHDGLSGDFKTGISKDFITKVELSNKFLRLSINQKLPPPTK